jgi:hypothetical protein
MDLEYRLFISKNGQLRMVMEELKNGMVRSVNVSDMTIWGVAVTPDLKGYFTGHGLSGNYRNRVLFTDE